MKENKFTHALKAATFSILGILLLTLIYIAANRFIFNTATNGERMLDPINPPAVPLSRVEAVPEGYPFPEFYLHHISVGVEMSPNALLPEDAAEIGAKYIWEMFGVDISGTSMYIRYNSFPTSTRIHWSGTVVVPSGSPFPEYYRDTWFSFAIDAMTGERIEIRDYRLDEIEVFGESVSGGNYEQLIEIFTQIATNYAVRHFNFSEIESMSYEGMNSIENHRVYFQDEDGDQHFNITGEPCCHLFNGETLLNFTAVDSVGRSANLAISMETERLVFLTTKHNDIIPGWESAPTGGRYAMTEYGPWITLHLNPYDRITAMQYLDGIDTHIFYDHQAPTLTLPNHYERHLISMDFSGDLIPLNAFITRRRADQIGHNYSIEFINLESTNDWTPGLYKYVIPVMDDGNDYFYFMRTTWPEGYVTNIFRINSSILQDTSVDIPIIQEHDMPDDLDDIAHTIWRVPPTLNHDHVINCSCGQFVINEWMHTIDPVTGLLVGYHGGHGGPEPGFVFDSQRQLFGHAGYGFGYHDMLGMHPIDEFWEMLASSFANADWWHNPRDGFITIERVDSSLRSTYEHEYLDINNELSSQTFWHLDQEAYSGRYALMYNGQFTTDFIFDGTHDHFANWNLVRDIGLMAVSMNGQWGLVDSQGNVVLPFRYENLVIIDQDTAFARYNGRYGILDLTRTIEIVE